MKSYKLEHDLYIKTSRFIRTYKSLQEQYEERLFKSVHPDRQPRGNKTGDPTGQTATDLVDIALKLRAIERGIKKVPMGYQEGLWSNFMTHKPYPCYAGISTWRRWRYRFVYWVAEEMGWV